MILIKSRIDYFRNNVVDGVVKLSRNKKEPVFRPSNASKENRELIIKFDNENKAQASEIRESTRISYLVTLHSFAEWLGGKNFIDVSKEDMINYINYLKSRISKRNREMKNSSIRTMQILLRKFYLWLNSSKEHPPCVSWMDFKKNYSRKILPEEILNEDEIKKMIETASSFRDKALVAVLYESGCRIGEFLNMRFIDLKFDKYGVIAKVSGKTGEREIRLVNSVPYLKEWLRVHPAKSPDSFVWAKTFNVNEPLTCTGVHNVLRGITKKCKMSKKVYPHLFRHSRASYLASKIPEPLLRKFMGWTDDSTMVKTYVHLSSSDVDSVLLNKIYDMKVEKIEEMNNKLVPKVCFNCGERNPVDYEYCLKCKWPLSADAIKAKEKQFLMLLTPEIIEKLIEQKIEKYMIKRMVR